MTLLDEIIDASTSDSGTTANLLRKVRVAAHLLGASEISMWAQRELSGYPEDAELPDYRVQDTAVLGILRGQLGLKYDTTCKEQVPNSRNGSL